MSFIELQSVRRVYRFPSLNRTIAPHSASSACASEMTERLIVVLLNVTKNDKRPICQSEMSISETAHIDTSVDFVVRWNRKSS